MELPALDIALADLDRALEDAAQLERPAVQLDLAPGDPVEVQQVIDEASLQLHVAADHLQALPIPLAESGFLLEQRDGREDGSQGRPQLMTEDGHELVLRPAGLLRRLHRVL